MLSVLSALVLGALAASAAAASPVPASGYQVSLKPMSSVITTGQPTTFTGTISPASAHPSRLVALRRWVRYRWLVLAIVHPTSGGGFSITHTFLMPSENGPTRLRICFPAYHFRFRGCAELAVTIERSSKRIGQHTAHEKRRHQLEAARKHREEKEQRRDREREEQRKRHEEAHQKQEAARSKRREEERQRRDREREERHKRHEEARRRHLEKRQ
jgi:flagellar biosynthesis GTPase FlhF